jgi:hypothetical protein
MAKLIKLVTILIVYAGSTGTRFKVIYDTRWLRTD